MVKIVRSNVVGLVQDGCRFEELVQHLFPHDGVAPKVLAVLQKEVDPLTYVICSRTERPCRSGKVDGAVKKNIVHVLKRIIAFTVVIFLFTDFKRIKALILSFTPSNKLHPLPGTAQLSPGIEQIVIEYPEGE